MEFFQKINNRTKICYVYIYISPHKVRVYHLVPKYSNIRNTRFKSQRPLLVGFIFIIMQLIKLSNL